MTTFDEWLYILLKKCRKRRNLHTEGMFHQKFWNLAFRVRYLSVLVDSPQIQKNVIAGVQRGRKSYKRFNIKIYCSQNQNT